MSEGATHGVAQHVEAGDAATGGVARGKSTDGRSRVRSRHCGADMTSKVRKTHTDSCPALLRQDRPAVDASEVAGAAAGAGASDSNPTNRGVQVTLRRVAERTALPTRQEGRRSEATLAWSEVDVLSHFGGGKRGGESKCLHCGAVVRGDTRQLKQHMGACRRLPEEHRRALDECAIAKAAAGAGMYGSNPVYRCFKVTGWLAAQCSACLEPVRGNSSALKRHKQGRCRGFPATWTEADVMSHFDEGKRAGESACRHCGAAVRGHSPQLKSHMAACRRLPEEHRRALNESEVAKAGAGVGIYGNPVYRGFKVTGWLVAQCKACLGTVRGNSSKLKRHKGGRCKGVPPATRVKADVGRHGDESTGAGSECVHCGAMVRGGLGQLKSHMDACRQLRDQKRRALDESEAANAAAGAGVDGGNPAYRGFKATGRLEAQCSACLETVRGDGSNLEQHKVHCVGSPADAPARATKRRRVSQRRARGAKPASPTAPTISVNTGPRLTPSPDKLDPATSVSASPTPGEPAQVKEPPLNTANSAAGRPMAAAVARAGATSSR